MRMRTVSCLAAVLLTTGLVTGLAAAPAFAGTGTFSPSGDAYTSQSNAGATHPTGSLAVNAGSTSERRTHLMFSVAGIPAGATNIAATLKLYAQQSATSGNVYTVYAEPSAWTEAALTWNSQPALGSSLGTHAGLTNGAYNSWTLASGAVTGNGTVSFAVRSNTLTSERDFNSRESASNKPQLVVTWTDPSGTPPAVTTGAASGVTATAATLNGTVNPEGAATTYHFEYGTTTAYGTPVPVPDGSAGSGSTAVPELANLTGLTASTTYHFRLVAANGSGTTNGADAQFTTPAALMDRKDLLKGTEIGEWQVPDSGAPTVSAPISAETVDAGSRLIRVAVADCFTGTTCGSNNHAGTVSRTAFDATIANIRNNLGAPVIWFKLLPTSHDYPDTATATSFCPPWTGDASGNLPVYEDQVNEIKAAGYTGPLVLEVSNEMYFDCTSGTTGPWDVQSGTNLSGGSVGVSKRVGEHYAAVAPQLKAYAQSLGFSEVAVGDDIGVPGGAQWGQSFVTDPAGPYGYTWTYSTRWIDEFNNAVHAAGAAAPDFEAWHAYVHSPDNYAAAPYEGTLGDPGSVTDDDQILYSYFRGQITKYRAEADAVWGAAAGDQIRFAVSEGSPGSSNSGGTWGGWTTAGRPGQFIAGWYGMLKGDGNLTGTGTRYWEYTLFCDACNGDTSGDRYYDIIRQDGTTPAWYADWKNVVLP